jgi:hypothetical protein
MAWPVHWSLAARQKPGKVLVGTNWCTWEHLPLHTSGDDAGAIPADHAGNILGGVGSACHPAGATVVGVISQVGLTAVSGDVVAVLIPGLQHIAGVATGGEWHR